MAVESRIAAVTGANKGIGLAIGAHSIKSSTIQQALTISSPVRNLALTYHKSPLRSGPFTIYLTARSPERGSEAVKTLEQDPQLREAKVLARDGGDTTISYHALDISKRESVEQFRDFLRKEHPHGIDAVM